MSYQELHRYSALATFTSHKTKTSYRLFVSCYKIVKYVVHLLSLPFFFLFMHVFIYSCVCVESNSMQFLVQSFGDIPI